MDNETLDTIHGLWSSHRNFTDKEIKEEDLQKILDASVRAANASGKQSYSIIALKDKGVIKELFPHVGNKVLIFCVDYNRIVDTAQHIGRFFDATNTYSFISGSIDACLAAQNAAIAARSLGIDSLFTNHIHRKLDKVYEVLDLPERLCFPMIALILGYAREKPGHLKDRLKGPGIIHVDKYRHPSSDEKDQIVDQYDAPDMGLFLVADWKEKGFPHYLDAFYDMMSKFAEERQGLYSGEILNTLVKSGFFPEKH